MDFVSRTKGHSVVAKAAYRSGERLEDLRYGMTHDYTRKQGVVYAGIVTPGDNPPEWMQDRAALWNRVEEVEYHPRAQLARDIELNLPHELDADTRRAITLEFAQHIADTFGFAVDVAIHAPHRHGDERNHHAHLLFATRALDADAPSGFVKAKDRRFNDVSMQREGTDNLVEPLREKWEDIQNLALERADVRDADGQPVRVSRLSYERQGSEREPTQHEGVAATALKRRGEDSERATENDAIRDRNAQRDELTKQIKADQADLKETVESVDRTPLGDEIRWRYRNLPEMKALYRMLDGEKVGRHQDSRLGAFQEYLSGLQQGFAERGQRQEQRLVNEILSSEYLTGQESADADALNLMSGMYKELRAAPPNVDKLTDVKTRLNADVESRRDRESDRAFPSEQEQREAEADSLRPASRMFGMSGLSFG